MITRIEIDGFKSFSNFVMDFSPMTVVAGANASGKSNLFDALQLLSRIAEVDDLRVAFGEQRGDAKELFTQYDDNHYAEQMTFRAVPKSLYMIPTMVNPIFGILLGYPVGGGPDGGFQGFAGAGLGRAQPSFEFTEGKFEGVEIGRIGRQIEQAGAPCRDNFGQASYFVGGQVVEYDHIARHQGGAEYVFEIGGKDVTGDGPAHGHGRL